MGDEPSEVDCSIFGMLCVAKRSPTGSPFVAAMEGMVTAHGTIQTVLEWNCCSPKLYLGYKNNYPELLIKPKTAQLVVLAREFHMIFGLVK